MKRKPVAGETLYSVNVGNAAWRCEQKITPMEVVSVGRKYFKARPVGGSKYSEVQFHLENWRENTHFCQNHELYESEEAWLEAKEADEIAHRLRAFFGAHGKCNISLDQLRRIEAITKEVLPDA